MELPENDLFLAECVEVKGKFSNHGGEKESKVKQRLNRVKLIRQCMVLCPSFTLI
jgi:hypothetical protein